VFYRSTARWFYKIRRCYFIDGPKDPQGWRAIAEVLPMDRRTLEVEGPSYLIYRWTDGPLTSEVHRWCFTDGPTGMCMVKSWLIYSTVWPMVCYFICYSFDRWSFNDATWLFVYPVRPMVPWGLVTTAWPTGHTVQK